jgi:hypothetical protein
MGGEQYPVLMYGPKECNTAKMWVEKLNLRNADNDYFDMLMDFLDNNGMTMAYDNNFWWEKPYIGVEVISFETFSEEKKEELKELCEKYNLSKPTFFAGIHGEFE